MLVSRMLREKILYFILYGVFCILENVDVIYVN